MKKDKLIENVACKIYLKLLKLVYSIYIVLKFKHSKIPLKITFVFRNY